MSRFYHSDFLTSHGSRKYEARTGKRAFRPKVKKSRFGRRKAFFRFNNADLKQFPIF